MATGYRLVKLVPMWNKRFILTIFSFWFLLTGAWATHNRAGEITYVQIDEFTYEITITTFTNTQPTTSGWPPVDRPVLEIAFGDNTTAMVDRVEMIDLPDYYRKNTYITTHTFPGPGTYELVVEDPNRNEGVSNIPNSVTVVFSIKTIMQINPALGPNSTPQLLSPPVDKAALNRLFIHNPAAWDPDGDSLAYKLTPCTGENGQPIEGFTFPDDIAMNETTGDLVWDKPTELGVFNVAILIEEWREGVKIGQITRDLQIEVYETDNMPPELLSEQQICVEAGDSVTIDIKGYDPDGDDLVLTPLGGAFEVDNPATYTTTGTVADTIYGQIKWGTDCSHIRRQPYLLVIKAEDQDEDIPLADLHHIQVWVNGPATQFTSVTPTNNSIELNWFSPSCDVTGYDLYRKTQSYQWLFDPCVTGIPQGSGYEKIASLDSAITAFTDNEGGEGLLQGFQYCYRIVPRYNDAPGYASAEGCETLVRGVPVITNVSIENTDTLNGKIYLAWSKPTEIDTLEHPGPYNYKIFRSPALWGSSFEPTPIATLSGLNDTLLLDSGMNTAANAYSYKVELHNTNGLVAQPMVASSLHLKTYGADNRVALTVEKNVPWINHTYAFYQVDGQNEILLAEVDTLTFLHENLPNDEPFYYRVKSTGNYTESGFVYPIVNFSQIARGIPVDTVPPEAPLINVEANCDAFYNEITWQSTDAEVVDVELYYASRTDKPLSMLRKFPYPDTTMYRHTPELSVSGCYSAKAIDSAGNRSAFSAKVCIDSCDYYDLPNVITTNNDGLNDVFRPKASDDIILKTIAEAEIQIFNRWGNLVFETTDPRILWYGRDKHTGKPVPSGVYYYICNLKEKRISGLEERYKVGFVHVYHTK